MASVFYSLFVLKILKKCDFNTILDYGAGKCRLKTCLELSGASDIEYRAYDPAFSLYGTPLPSDLVVCLDVLEHVEPDKIENVISHLYDNTIHLCFLSVDTGPSSRFLPDGRNAHLLQIPITRWREMLEKKFKVYWISNKSYIESQQCMLLKRI